MQNITPCLWFNFNAEEAVRHYLSVFKDGKILELSRYGDATPALSGKALMIVFEIQGQRLQALNGGPTFPLTEAISLSVSCDTQAEIDRLWAQLSAGGSTSQCGWLKDKFGLSWQIVPSVLGRLLTDADTAKVARVTAAFMKMTKFDIAGLEQAYAGP